VEPEVDVAPEPVPGSQKPKGETLISMEAEYYDVKTETATHQWVRTVLGNSSNDDAMITTPDEGQLAGTPKNTPMLSYMVYFNHPGKHYLWVRGLGDSNKSGVGNSDSIQIGLNGKLADTAYRIDQFPSEWTWSRHTPSNPVASLNVVNAGVNMVNIWMREDGLAIDKFVITSDPEFVPNGFGPAVTDGTNDYVPPVPVVEDSKPTTPVVEDTGTSDDDIIVSDPTDENRPATDDGDVKPVEPVVNDTQNPVASDQADADEEESDTGKVDETGDSAEEVVTLVPVANSAGSNNGLFGGSASTMALLTLLLLCLTRAGRLQRAARL